MKMQSFLLKKELLEVLYIKLFHFFQDFSLDLS